MLNRSFVGVPQFSMWQLLAYVLPGAVAFCVVYWALVARVGVTHDPTSFFVATLPASLLLGHLVAPLGVLYNRVFGRYFPHRYEHWDELRSRVCSHTGLNVCTNTSIYRLSSKIATHRSPACTIAVDELLQMAWLARNTALVLLLSGVVIVIVEGRLWLLSVVSLIAQPVFVIRYFSLLNRHKNHLFDTVLVMLSESRRADDD